MAPRLEFATERELRHAALKVVFDVNGENECKQKRSRRRAQPASGYIIIIFVASYVY